MQFPPFFRRGFRITDYRPDPDRDVREEIAFYLEMRAQEFMNEGLSREEADREARRLFGDLTEIETEMERIQKLEIRRRQRELYMDALMRDVRFAVRTIVKQPTYSALIVAMLALGIAGNAAIFSVINSVLLKPFPYEQADQLVYLNETAPQWNLEFTGIAFADFAVWREQNRGFDAIGVWSESAANMAGSRGSVRVEILDTSYDLITTLRLPPVIGRAYSAEEDAPEGERVVLLIERFWREQFGGDPSAVGQRVTLGGEPYEIIGVLPDQAAITETADMWRPLYADPEQRGSYYLDGIGRLREGVTPATAQEDLQRIQRGLIEEEVAPEEALPVVVNLREMAFGDIRLALLALWGAVAAFLIIACINVASLMLARAIAREQEFGIRAAIGAGRGQLIRQMLTESLLFAAAGGVLGILIARGAVSLLTSLLPLELPPWMRFTIDGKVLLFSAAICILAALLSGIGPAFRTAGRRLVSGLSQGGRTGVDAGRRRMLGAFVIGEISLSLVMLITLGLLFQAYRNLGRVDPGFEPEGVLAFRLALPDADYSEAEQRLDFWDQLVQRLEALPGITAVGACSSIPMRGHSGYFFEAEGARPLETGQQDPVTLTRFATPGYDEALGLRLKWGRFLEPGDQAKDERMPPAVVNESFARHHWGDENPVGRRIKLRGSTMEWGEVVGVVFDTRHYGLDTPMRPGLFVPATWRPQTNLGIVMRSTTDPTSFVPGVREIVGELDPTLAVYGVETMREIVRGSLSFRRGYSQLLGVFAFASLLLALAGLYGVVSYTVNQRTREIGIRVALGANSARVVRMVLVQGTRLVLAGAAIGIGLALLAGSALSSLLYGIESADLPTLIVVTLILAGMTIIASLLPALRASRVDPSRALRVE